MKGLLAITLAGTAFFGWGATPAFATRAMFYCDPETLNYAIGGRCTLNIMVLDSNPAIPCAGYQVSLHWNPSLLHCDTLKDGSWFPTTTHGYWIITSDSIFAQVATLSRPFPPPPYRGQLCYLCFTVLAAGSCSLRFGPPDLYGQGVNVCQLCDTNAMYFPCSTDTRGWFQSRLGVEQENRAAATWDRDYEANPNPFNSFASIPGHEKERFILYDISGRWLGTYLGDRIGEGLSAGVYFLRPQNGPSKSLRLVKVR